MLTKLWVWILWLSSILAKTTVWQFNAKFKSAIVPPSPNPGPTIQPQPAIDHYNAVSTFHDDRLLQSAFTDALLRLLGTRYRKVSLILTVTMFKCKRETFFSSYSFSLPSSQAHCLAPAPLKLWPYGAIQICLWLLLLLLKITSV